MISDVIELSRDELYKRVWSQSGTKLAAQLGISDVALGKICKRLGVPRPPRGYWAKLAAGKTVRQDPLPAPIDNQDRILQFRPPAALSRSPQVPMNASTEPPNTTIPQVVSLPHDASELHPEATRVLAALNEKAPREDGRVQIGNKHVPTVVCSPQQADRVARVVHALTTEAERQNLTLQFTAGTAGPALRFARKEDFIDLHIEEIIEDRERPPTAEDKRRPSWTWNTKTRELSGKLHLQLTSNHRISGRRQWNETDTKSIEYILPKILQRVDELFRSFDEWRAAEARRQEEAAAHARLMEQERRKKLHQDRLNETEDARAVLLRRAAEWWRIAQTTLEFINACERTWRGKQDGQITAEQEEWMSWARKSAEATSPLAIGYPDPLTDGPFDRDAVSADGPYPTTRQISEPPTYRAQEQRPYNSYYQSPSPQQYPFWLANQRR